MEWSTNYSQLSTDDGKDRVSRNNTNDNSNKWNKMANRRSWRGSLLWHQWQQQLMRKVQYLSDRSQSRTVGLHSSHTISAVNVDIWLLFVTQQCNWWTLIDRSIPRIHLHVHTHLQLVYHGSMQIVRLQPTRCGSASQLILAARYLLSSSSSSWDECHRTGNWRSIGQCGCRAGVTEIGGQLTARRW